jgi:glycosyltransferase involved in cell wall biosynthesis
MQLVVIPVFNEEQHLAEVLCELRKWHHGEVLVVNDGSTDKTAEILGSHCCKALNVITHGRNKGYGASLIEGFRFAIENNFEFQKSMAFEEKLEFSSSSPINRFGISKLLIPCKGFFNPGG